MRKENHLNLILRTWNRHSYAKQHTLTTHDVCSVFFNSECNVWYARDPQTIQHTQKPHTHTHIHVPLLVSQQCVKCGVHWILLHFTHFYIAYYYRLFEHDTFLPLTKKLIRIQISSNQFNNNVNDTANDYSQLSFAVALFRISCHIHSTIWT